METWFSSVSTPSRPIICPIPNVPGTSATRNSRPATELFVTPAVPNPRWSSVEPRTESTPAIYSSQMGVTMNVLPLFDSPGLQRPHHYRISTVSKAPHEAPDVIDYARHTSKCPSRKQTPLELALDLICTGLLLLIFALYLGTWFFRET